MKVLTAEVLASIESSVLCWLATSSDDEPNVSPKEVFREFEGDIIVANIASPQTVDNIQSNPKVCISFIDVLVQKGFQVKGKAEIIDAEHIQFEHMREKLEELTHGKYPFETITHIIPESVKPIVAPSYFLFPDTTEQQQIESARKNYNL